MRNFTLKTEDGELLSYANSIWTNIDTETGLPARLTDEDIRGYELDEKLEMDYAPRKIALPEGMEARSLLQYRNIIWTPITMLIIASISAWGRLSARRLCDPTDEGRI